MKIKRKYSTPHINEYFVDKLISLWAGSGITPPEGMAAPEPTSPPAGPAFENPSASEYPFGGESPDYSNM